MNVLVDTSVWVGHFKRHEPQLVALLEAGRVVCHPNVVVEVACGTPPNRRALIGMLSELASAPVATPAELLTLIDRQGLHGRGVGLVDVSLLASALISGHALWTLDSRLDAVAQSLGCRYQPALAS